MTTRHIITGSLIVFTATPFAAAQTPTYRVIPNATSALDLSPDGRFIVGNLNGGIPYRLDRLTGVITSLPAPGLSASAVSDDGSVVLGDVPDPEGIGSNVAGIWTAATGWQSLGALPNALGCPSRSDGFELSADGTVAVGLSWDGCSGRGFWWTQATGMLELEPLANGGNRASVVSADGALIGGFAQGSTSRTPAIWSSDLTGQLLDPPNGDVNGEVFGMSDDGTVLTGTWDSKPFIFEQGQPIQIFNPVLTGWAGRAMDLSNDGTIVGFDSLLLSRRAWIRPNGGPAVDLRNYLLGLGVTGLPPVLEVCQAISINGNIIIGLNSFGPGWIVNLCPADLSGNGAVDFADILAVIGAWGPCGGCAADLDGSGDVGFGDILAVIAAWGSCPH